MGLPKPYYQQAVSIIADVNSFHKLEERFGVIFFMSAYCSRSVHYDLSLMSFCSMQIYCHVVLDQHRLSLFSAVFCVHMWEKARHLYKALRFCADVVSGDTNSVGIFPVRTTCKKCFHCRAEFCVSLSFNGIK